MPYVDRDSIGNIKGVFACAQHTGQEYVDGSVELWKHPNVAILEQISALEQTQTPRRIREATTPAGAAWLDTLNAQIAALRGQLK